MTADTIHWRIDMLLGDDLATDLGGVAVRGPVKLGDEIGRAQIRSWVSVAFEAETHVKRLDLLHLNHLVDAAMATDATDSCRNVRTVIKVDVVGQTVNLDPRHGLSSRIALPDRLQQRAGGLNPCMTIHTSFGGGNGRKRCLVNRVMAVIAIHAKVACMEFVAVGHRLFRGVAGLYVVRRCEVGEAGDTQYRADAEHHTENLDVPINCFREECRHCGLESSTILAMLSPGTTFL